MEAGYNREEGLKRLAYIVSVITHPLLMPLAGIALVYLIMPYRFQQVRYQFIFFGIVFFFTFLVPALLIVMLKKNEVIETYDMHHREERRLPLFLTSALFLMNYYFFMKADVQSIYRNYFLAISAVAVCTVIANIFFKISLHTIGIGSITGLLWGLSSLPEGDLRPYIILSIMVFGVIASSRLLLKAHTLPQIYWGYALGVLVMYIMMSI